MTTWSNTQKSTGGVSEIDFLFSDATDFLFSDSSDFVFVEGSAATAWAVESKSTTTWTPINKS